MFDNNMKFVIDLHVLYYQPQVCIRILHRVWILFYFIQISLLPSIQVLRSHRYTVL
jgi:hypothetical protein